MGTLHPQELLKQWELEKIPIEMATGHSLQNLVHIALQLLVIFRRLTINSVA
ncbi:MAG: hypothetical protein Fur0044_02690 [Anaerolineae bacterium]